MSAPAWHGAPPETWRERWGLPDLRIFHAVGSTNDVARELALAGAPAGTVVLADEQTRGRGRRGRDWRAAPGQGLLLSMVLRPAGANAAILPLRVGLAAARAVEDAAGIPVGIKWPNDVVVGDRKLGGVLCEGAVAGERHAFVIAGVGLNVLQSDDDFPPDLRGLATSIAAATGRAVDLPALAGKVVARLSMAAEAGGTPLAATELEALARRDVLVGREVTVDGRPAGTAAGIDRSGALLVRKGATIERIYTGTVRPADAGAGPESDQG